MTIAVTGGGTGGHIYPALAVCQALRELRPGVDLVYLGGSGGLEERLVVEEGIPFVALPARKVRKLLAPDTLLALLALWRGYRRARAELRRTQPRALLATGGYAAAAAARAAASMGVPVILHEQNAVAGRTNRWLSRYAVRVCLTFEASASAFPPDRTVVTGLPIRTGVMPQSGRESSRAALGIPADVFVVLVLGGSQGALAINDAVRAALDCLPDNVFVLHQTGPRDATPPPKRPGYRCMPYLDARTLPLAYGSADIVVSRCGASTLAEILANGLPAILIPYPAAYADHQTANAKAVVQAGAAVLMPQSEMTPQRLADTIVSLMECPEKLSDMASAALRLARPDAAKRVAEVVLECAERPR